MDRQNLDKVIPKSLSAKWRQHKLDMCLWNTDAPSGKKAKIWQKIFKSYILTPPHPQGHVMSVKCEEPIDELTVQV